ncbi:peptidoglycan DD-metalloendopeptidase family protein [Pseudoalteromonas sp. MMG010]|uniref:peptidoglycan DD-metalloendopeptidase family protein n=1 Tax=Pseudoalteromonas sp. MMG010 TaxID=2822685 RepID=UPI001B3A53B9|nr:peptidoglycan DD-metalloendopeptidase family protein [Pseudoalteromonas sp. MMG010]MBQ4831956.1 peptidoglycan DD-metalloendopeptidase family protein [Pseudoalteromonas sp. MMG010]
MKKHCILHVIFFFNLLLLGCSSRNAPAPVSSLNSNVNDSIHSFNIYNGDYTVRKHDTLYSISFSSGVDFRELAKINSISAPYVIYPGQVISLIPSSNKIIAKQNVKKTPKKTNIIKQKNNKKLNKELDKPKQREYVKPKVSNKVSHSKHLSNNKIKWIWPAKGKIAKHFSNKENGYKGLQITNKKGAPVLAAAKGTVVYAGNALRGYGNLIILKHNDDYLSAYAHNSKLLVKEKQEINAGQKIAEIGNSESPVTALRFEIRYRGKAVNPAKYLP